MTHPDIKIPKKGKIYSINEGNAKNWNEPITEFVNEKKYGKNPYSLRYKNNIILYKNIFII